MNCQNIFLIKPSLAKSNTFECERIFSLHPNSISFSADAESFGKLQRAMLERGVYLAPSAFEAGFTSLAHSEDDIDATLKAFNESFNEIS